MYLHEVIAAGTQSLQEGKVIKVIHRLKVIGRDVETLERRRVAETTCGDQLIV